MIKINQKLDHPLEHKTECLILACVEEKKPTEEKSESTASEEEKTEDETKS